MNGPTTFEKIAALAVMTGVALVVIAVGWFVLTVWLSAIEYVQALP